MGHREQAEIVELAVELGVVVTEREAEMLLAHLGKVLEANQYLNLTAITDRESAIRLHVVDSLALVPYVRSAEGRVVDIGSGAGYPGVPISIITTGAVDMIESVKKKALFLAECIQALGGLSGSQVLPVRAEEVAETRSGHYNVVTARALSSLPSLVELASPLLGDGGQLLAMKGSPETQELDSGRRAALIVGLEETERVEYVLPKSGESRTVVRYTKVGEPTIELPRRIGLAQKRPLG